MQNDNSKQDHPGQEHYEQPDRGTYKLIIVMLYELCSIHHGFVHNKKYILISFLGDYPGQIDENNVCRYACTGKH